LRLEFHKISFVSLILLGQLHLIRGIGRYALPQDL
jgi:hypothetical protein